ncbi:MAG: hypothetical protein IT370_08935 [Deltaproteobacteria bacterium]|nr:hypothetical protein [Deltaproteobacteria bacterium]
MLVCVSCASPRDSASGRDAGAAAVQSATAQAPPADSPPPAALLPVNAPLELEMQQVAGEDAPELEISRSDCERAGCTLTIAFSHPMVAPKGLAKARLPRLTFEPPQRGKLAWKSPTELVFTPAAGQLPWGHEFALKLTELAAPAGAPELVVPGAWQDTVQVPHFSAAGKVASWPVIAGKPRFVSLLSATSQVGAGPLFMLFDQPVDPAKIASKLRATSLGKRALELRVERPGSAAQVYDGKVDTAYLVAVTVVELPGDGEPVSFAIPSWSAAGTAIEPIEKNLVANSTFALRVFNGSSAYGGEEDYEDGGGDPSAGQRAPLRVNWRFGFSGSVTVKGIERALTITPRPKNLSISTSGATAEVAATLAPGQLYQLSVAAGLTDVLGNRLGVPATFRVRAEDLAPSLELPAAALVLENGHARLPIRGRNLGALTVKVHRLASAVDFIHAVNGGDAPCAQRGATPEATRAAAPADRPLNQPFTDDIALNTTGFLCLEALAQGRGSAAALSGPPTASALVQVTGLGVTAKVFDGELLVWATRLADGDVVAGAPVTLRDHEGSVIARASTGADGVARVPARDLAGRLGLLQSAFSELTSGTDHAVVALADDRLSDAWRFGLPGEAKGTRLLGGAVFTERGIYRPGETVHIKAILADADDARASKTPAHLSIKDPRGQELYSGDLALDGFGSADHDVALKSTAAVGEYSLRVELGERALTRRFHVEEYRVPTFAVSIDADEATWKYGQPVHAGVAARYLHGGNLGGREVTYSVSRTPVRFAPGNFPRFVFTSEGQDTASSTMLSHGKGRLDGEGRLGVAFTPDHAARAGAMRYVVDASVTDVDRQVYAGRTAQTVHPAAFYLGVAPPAERVLAAGDTLEVPVVAVDPEGRVRPRVAVSARLERVEHQGAVRLAGDGAQRLDREVIETVASCKTTTRAAAVTCSFRVPRAGQYRVRAAADDPAGRRVETGFDLNASGKGEVAWPRFDHERIELITDKQSYRAGDVARLMVASPFGSARGLLTLERGGILEHRLFRIDGDTPVIEVPITADHAPNIYASVVLLRGRIHDKRDASGFETGAPAFRMGYARLAVEPRERRLAVDVKPATDKAHPGHELALDVAVRDSTGRPAAGQATVMVVDEAVLGLTRHRTPDPVAELNPEQPLGVRTLESRLELPYAQRLRHEQLFPAGDGGDGFSLQDLPAELRTLMQSTAYWNPRVPIGADGRAHISFKLPDNVTTYRVMAVVVDAAGRAGSGQAGVLVRRPLIVQPVLPRFVYPGDSLTVEARVFNGTGAAGKVVVTAGFVGLDGSAGAGPASKGPAQQERAIAADGSEKFSFPVTVRGPVVIGKDGKATATVKFVARLGNQADAVELAVPVLNPGSRRRLIERAQISGQGQVAIQLPEGRLPGSTMLEVMVSTTSLSELKGAVDRLMDYPNGCLEQTTSTAYPLVVLSELLPEMGVTVDEAALKKFSTAGVARILSFQTSGGGLSYWPGGSEPHAFGTAFGLTALIEAKKRGYDVPEAALARMASFLEESLRKGEIKEEMPHAAMADADTRALFVMTLGRLGRPQSAYVPVLWQQRGKLTPFGLAFLAVAVAEGAGDRALLPAILGDIRAAAKVEPEQAYYEGDRAAGWSMGSPLRTHAGALLAYALASPPDEMRAKLLTGLIKRQQGGSWGNTQEDVFGIMAVAALASSPSTAAAAGAASKGDTAAFALTRDGAAVPAKALEVVSRRVQRLRLDEAALGKATTHTFALENRGPPSFLTVRAEYDVSLDDPANRVARASGFTITRRYETAAGVSLEGKKIPLGALVRVRLRVTGKDKQNYVAIDDKLPAGLEPLNANLATTEQVAAGKLTPEVSAGLQFLSHSELRDARVAFYADELPAGSYEFVYLARATTPGKFLRPAAGAEAMYAPEVIGATAIDDVIVE